jgi:23S rRNA pseudouridine1911/1915/1917 synthase
MVLQDSNRCWVVGAPYSGLRLDIFVRQQLPFLSRSEVEAAIRSGWFLVNHRIARKGDKLAIGDAVQFVGPAALLAEAPVANPDLVVPVLHEDAQLLAVDKPAGMDCHGFSARQTDCLVNFLMARWPYLTEVGRSRWEPGLVHRIDRETSGIVLVAKSQAVFNALRNQFRRRAVKKTYVALVFGSSATIGVIDLPLARDSKDERKMHALADSASARRARNVWPALTRFRKLCEREGMSLLELEMRTGVTHQLRAHLAALNWPIVGDRLYGGDRQDTFGLGRHFLHAAQLRFRHPESGRMLTLTAPLPNELTAVLDRLEVPLKRLGLGSLENQKRSENPS